MHNVALVFVFQYWLIVVYLLPMFPRSPLALRVLGVVTFPVDSVNAMTIGMVKKKNTNH